MCRWAAPCRIRFAIRSCGSSASSPEVARSAAPLHYVRAGDINGDGLDDVIGIAGDTGAQTLVVFPQCSSRDLSTCGAHP